MEGERISDRTSFCQQHICHVLSNGDTSFGLGFFRSNELFISVYETSQSFVSGFLFSGAFLLIFDSFPSP